MGCATGLVKYFVFFENLLFSLGGLALMIIGIVCQLNYKEAANVVPSGLAMAPILCIIIGAIVFFIAFLGCCGAVKESPCMLTTYAIVLLVLFIAQLSVGIWAFMQVKNTDQLNNSITTNMRELFQKYDSNNAQAKETVDFIQSTFECCGAERYSDILLKNGALPQSCCQKGTTFCTASEHTLFNQGCAQRFSNILENNMHIVWGVLIGIAIIEILGAIFGFCLASSIRKHYYERHTYV